MNPDQFEPGGFGKTSFVEVNSPYPRPETCSNCGSTKILEFNNKRLTKPQKRLFVASPVLVICGIGISSLLDTRWDVHIGSRVYNLLPTELVLATIGVLVVLGICGFLLGCLWPFNGVVVQSRVCQKCGRRV